MVLASMILISPALGALPSSLPIDSQSLDDLLAGRDVCGDAENRASCLQVIDCALADPLLGCSAENPVWTPGQARGGKDGREVLFRRVLPLPAGPHPNDGSLAQVRGRLVGSPAMQQLPSAVSLYDKSQAKPHKEQCEARYCVIPAALYLVNEAGVAYPSCKIKVSSNTPSPRRP